jgi:hypothetical protein
MGIWGKVQSTVQLGGSRGKRHGIYEQTLRG